MLVVLILVCAALAAGLIVGGVFLLAGTGWAMIAAGAGFLALAAILRMGLMANG